MASPTIPEIATAASDPYVPNFQGVLQPTDEVLASRGGASAIKIYDEIRRDPHAFAILQKLKLEVVSREWFVTPASESRLDKKAAAEVERQFKAINYDRLTKGLLGAVLKGFSVAEVLWSSTSLGWQATAVKVKKQRRFRFTVDGELRMLTRSNTIDGEPVPDRKFIVHRHSIDDDDDDPYGVGLGSVLFWPAWFKRQVLAHWLRGSEKHATPTTVLSYEGAYDKKRQDEMIAVLRQMANDTGLVIPKSVEADLLEAANGGGGEIFEKLARYLDELMSEATLGETLTTNSGERGARSLGEIHNEIRIAIAKAASDLISATIKDTLVRWIVELNFPGAGLPDVWRDFSEAEDLDQKVKRDETISRMGYKPKSVDYINETYGGDWIEKQPDQTDDEDPAAPGATAGLDFADNPASVAAKGAEVIDQLSDQLDGFAEPAIDAMIEAIHAEFQEARDYDDLIRRLAGLSAKMGVNDLAGILEQGITLARLEGHDSVSANG
jgi:phage gp29-like protein